MGLEEMLPSALAPDLPATPMTLLDLATTFDNYGYRKLARHLRAAADQLAAVPHRDVHAVLVASRYETDVGASRYGVVLKGGDDAVHQVLLGQEYALVAVPSTPDSRQQPLPGLPGRDI